MVLGQSTPSASSAVAQSADSPVVGLGHDPEQSGAMLIKSVRDGEIGGER